MVAIGKATALILAAMGKDPDGIAKAIPWAALPPLLASEPEGGDIQEPLDPDPRVDAMLRAGG